MNSLSLAIVGDASIAPSLGKFSSKTDITMYDQKGSDTIVTYYVASSYPEKIQSLVQILAMVEWPILSVGKLDKFLGEQIVAIDSFGFQNGFVLRGQEVTETDLKKIISGTSLERFIFVDSIDSLKAGIAKLSQKISGDERIEIVVDQFFNVKGVGTVVLGAVKSGKVKVHDALELLPVQKEIGIKSIQMHDEDVKEASAGARVGLSVKGVVVEDFSRGDVIATKGSMSIAKDFSIQFEKSKFYKGGLKPDVQYHLAVGAKVNPVKVKSAGENLETISEKAFAFSKKERCVLLDMNSQGLRIVGSGKIM